MSKSVNKHCSILNYLEDKDPTLYKIIKHLCMGGMFKVRKHSSGLTFLRPDSNLVDKLKKLAYGDNPEEAVQVIQSMILLDNLESLDDFANNKDDISTFLRKKLPVASANSKSVMLTNGAEIRVDDDFDSRNDKNISVHLLSKEFVPTDTEPASGSNNKPKVKKMMGGADYNGGRAKLFINVLIEHARCEKRNPSLEVLVNLMQYLENSRSSLLSGVMSQLSGDTIASLAIVLQPFRSAHTYIDDATYNAWAASSTRKETSLYYYGSAPLAYYARKMQEAAVGKKEAMKKLKEDQEALVGDASKPTIVKGIMGLYANLTNYSYPHNNAVLAFAEAELRVFSTLLQQNFTYFDAAELLDLFQNKCTLESPYICQDRQLVMGANVGFYYSTVYLLARSDALVYIPKYADEVGIKELAFKGMSNGGSALLQLVPDTPMGSDEAYPTA